MPLVRIKLGAIRPNPDVTTALRQALENNGGDFGRNEILFWAGGVLVRYNFNSGRWTFLLCGDGGEIG
jgi:hypothetical protein